LFAAVIEMFTFVRLVSGLLFPGASRKTRPENLSSVTVEVVVMSWPAVAVIVFAGHRDVACRGQHEARQRREVATAVDKDIAATRPDQRADIGPRRRGAVAADIMRADGEAPASARRINRSD